MIFDKKGEFRRILMILIVMMLSFMVFVAVLGLAETAEEEKARLDAELAEVEQKLAIISAGFGQDFGGLLCGVEQIKYNNYNCDNFTAFHIVKVLTVGVHNQRFNFSDFLADAHNLASVAGGTTNGSINRFVDDSELIFEGSSVYYLLSSMENENCKFVVVKSDCGLMPEEVVNIKLRIEEIERQLKELEVGE